MQATADSRIDRTIGAADNMAEWYTDIPIMKLPSRDSKRCPAIRLAVRRTHRVMGRIMVLTSSITTMNDIRAGGVPSGVRWISICLVLSIHPNIEMESQ